MAITHLTGLSVSRVTGEGGGTVGITGPLTVSGTLIQTGSGAVTIRGAATHYSNLTVTGGELKLTRKSGIALAGQQNITVGGSATIACTRVHTTSAIILTVQDGTTTLKRARIGTITPGTSFKIWLARPVGTVATAGTVHWLVVN